jgi:hypothetical protein
MATSPSVCLSPDVSMTWLLLIVPFMGSPELAMDLAVGL